MSTKNEIANYEGLEFTDEELTLDELDVKLKAELDVQMADLAFLEEEREKIGNPDNLGNVIKDVVWEQFLIQISEKAGEDFLKENNGLSLDLRSEAHIQTTENFEVGKIAVHNTEINYQQRYDDWQSNFQKDPNTEHKTSNYRYNEEKKVWEKYDTRSDSWKKVLNADARSDFDKGRPTGKNTANTNMDHIISAGEIIRDPAANAHMTREEQVAFANSEKNLNLMDSAANQSKGDSTMSDFLDSERGGKKAAERFDIDEEALRKKDTEAREEYNKQKTEAEEESIAAGKQSQKNEVLRIGEKTLRVVLMQLLGELIKEIIGKLIRWFKTAKKALDTLLDSLKEAIRSFIGKMKTHLIKAGNTVLSTIATAIIGPVVGTIRKVWMLLKQGWTSLKKAIAHLKDPANKGKPIGILVMEVGKIVIAGMTAAGALLLGEVIEKGLMNIPGLAIEIPLIGSLASIIGVFMGAVVAGIVGAIAINLIDRNIARQQKNANLNMQIDKANEILQTQNQLKNVSIYRMNETKAEFAQSTVERHAELQKLGEDLVTTFRTNDEEDDVPERLCRDSEKLDALLN